MKKDGWTIAEQENGKKVDLLVINGFVDHGTDENHSTPLYPYKWEGRGNRYLARRSMVKYETLRKGLKSGLYEMR